jgi:adenosylmethionine-8-amino-7-oxononanoate aminotransferase
VRQRGLIGAVELVQDRATKTPFPWQQRRGFHVCELARKKGVWLRPLVNVIAIVPPLSVTIDELDQICAAIEFGIRQSFA